jgi:hypothetical protein
LLCARNLLLLRSHALSAAIQEINGTEDEWFYSSLQNAAFRISDCSGFGRTIFFGLSHARSRAAGVIMPNWLELRAERPASYRNTIGLIIAFIILGVIYFNLLEGASVFLGSHDKPRMESSAIIGLSIFCTLFAIFFVGAPALPDQKRYSLSVLFILTLVSCAVVGFYSFTNHAWCADEYAYLFEADTFRALRLWNSPPPLGDAQSTYYIWVKDAKWVAQYPPGWPLILALFGGSFPTGRLANGACTLVAAYAVYELVKARANREAAWVAVLFFLISPFVLFHGGSLFSHTSAAALAAMSMLVSYKVRQSPRVGLLIALGVCIGMLGLTRNVAAVAVVIAVIVEQIRGGRLAYKAALITLGGAPFLIGLLAYQYTITGHATMPVYWYAGRTVDHLYFDLPSILIGLRRTLMNQAELILLTSPLVHVIWLAALWKIIKNKLFLGSDLIFVIGMLIFVFYPLHPGFRIGPRYYLDFWPLAVVTIGAAIPLFHGVWRNLYRKALVVSIIYAGIMSLFLVFALRDITQSKFEMYERVKADGLTNAVVCVDAHPIRENVYAKMEDYNAARNGINLGDPNKAALLDVIYVDCSKTTLSDVRAAYPQRTLWEYKSVDPRQPGVLQPMRP